MKLTFIDCLFVLAISLFSAFFINTLFRERNFHISMLTKDPEGFVVGIERISPYGQKHYFTIYSPWNYEQVESMKKNPGIIYSRGAKQ